MLDPGTEVISSLIGKYSGEATVMIYGAAATGKTTCCYHAAISCIRSGSKVIYLDCENTFNPDRFSEMAGSSDLLGSLFLMKIGSFAKQEAAITNLVSLAKNDSIKLVIVDTIGIHYRRALQDDVKSANASLSIQLKILSDLRKTGKIILLTNQVYHNMEKGTSQVGGQITRHRCAVMIELEKDDLGIRRAILRKPEQGKASQFQIVSEGLRLHGDIAGMDYQGDG